MNKVQQSWCVDIFQETSTIWRHFVVSFCFLAEWGGQHHKWHLQINLNEQSRSFQRFARGRRQRRYLDKGRQFTHYSATISFISPQWSSGYSPWPFRRHYSQRSDNIMTLFTLKWQYHDIIHTLRLGWRVDISFYVWTREWPASQRLLFWQIQHTPIRRVKRLAWFDFLKMCKEWSIIL